MKKVIAMAITAIVIIGAAILWPDSQKETKIYISDETGCLYSLEFSERGDKITGNLTIQRIIEKPGDEPFIEKKQYSLSGTKKNDTLTITAIYNDETKNFKGKVSGTGLTLTEENKNPRQFRLISKEDLNEHVKKLEEELETAIYHAEEKEKSRIREFFTELRNVYGFLYTDPNKSTQLFITIDEALLEGEVSGSLLMITVTGEEQNPYEETTYPLNGITDGIMLELYTDVNGVTKKLEGNYKEDSVNFQLKLWNSDEKLPFEAVTEEEYKQKSEEFKNHIKETR